MPLPSHSSFPRGEQIKRSAVLYDPSYEHSPAVGVALEYEDRVDNRLPSVYAMPAYYREPITVGGTVTIGPATYKPGVPEYFDAVLADLGRAFGVMLIEDPNPGNSRSPFGV